MKIGNKELIEMFGTEINKKRYQKVRKVNGSMKANLLSRAKKKYRIVKDLGRGKYIIDEEIKKGKSYLKPKKKKINMYRGRRVCYPFIDYEECYDFSIGVYCVTYRNDIYIGSTTTGFRERHSQYSLNSLNARTKASKLIDKGGKINILWISDNKDETKIRNKEIEFIRYYNNLPNWNVVNDENMVTDFSKIKDAIIKTNYSNIPILIDFMNKNNIKFSINKTK